MGIDASGGGWRGMKQLRGFNQLASALLPEAEAQPSTGLAVSSCSLYRGVWRLQARAASSGLRKQTSLFVLQEMPLGRWPLPNLIF